MNITLYESLFKQYPDVVNVSDLQTMLGIGRNTSYSLVNSGEIHSIRVGAIIKIPKICIIDYLMKQ